MENIEEVIAAFRETLMFLVEQEKQRGEQVSALNEKIESLSSFVMENIVNPSIDAYNEERFNEFDEKYGERLGKYDDTLQKSMNDPEYSASREAWDELESLPQEDREGIDEEAYVQGVEEGLAEYVDNIKKSLGLPEDAAVEITDDGEGNIEVEADTDGDGEVDTTVTDEEGAEPETEEEYSDEPSQEEMDAYLRGDDLEENK